MCLKKITRRKKSGRQLRKKRILLSKGLERLVSTRAVLALDKGLLKILNTLLGHAKLLATSSDT